MWQMLLTLRKLIAPVIYDCQISESEDPIVKCYDHVLAIHKKQPGSSFRLSAASQG